ncbi:MAG TPA: pantoate--beta-alanine ligase [Acidimicrobiales bacterium]
MLKLSDVTEWRAYANELRSKGHTIGLVPTMGALHEGHISLIRKAKSRGDVVLATIFLNPRQFHDTSDLERYPRTPEHDLTVALESGVDCLIEPTLQAMWPDYPDATLTTVTVNALSDTLEGAGRPGHFDGVASIVAKLFAITGPSRAYFGEKDYQQLCVIKRMARDLAFGVDVVGCPIVRDDDGLALSSRNVLLSSEGRERARSFSRALKLAGEQSASASELRATLRHTLDAAGVDVAYAEVVDPRTLAPSGDDETGERRALVAGFVEGVRLIDNGPVKIVER